MNPGDQREHWESIYRISSQRFGVSPSHIGLTALDLLRAEGAETVLELGCGQGRDTLLFLESGIRVIAIDYSPTCLVQLGDTAAANGLGHLLSVREADIREGIPLPDGSVDGCFSHMFFTMHLTEGQLSSILSEVLRVLRPGGLNIYSVRNVSDPHYRQGVWLGEDMWEWGGFVVHYFSREKVERLARGWELVGLEEFEEGDLPKRLYQVVLRKPS